MKTTRTLTWLLPLALCAQWAAAQDNPTPPPPGDRPLPPPPPGEMRRGNGQGPFHRPFAEGAIRERLRENATNAPGQGPRMLMERPDGQMAAPFEGVRRYMAKLKEENPEKYEKLMKLQQENPAEFRKLLRGHMTKEIMKKKLEGFPEIREAIEKMPEERRMELGCRFLGFQGMGAPGMQQPPPGERGEQRGPPQRMEKLRDLSHKVQQAGTEDQRAAAKNELMKEASAAFDENIQERMAHLERMEQEIKRIRAELEQQKGNKEKLIRERIERALDRKADRDAGPREMGPRDGQGPASRREGDRPRPAPKSGE